MSVRLQLGWRFAPSDRDSSMSWIWKSFAGAQDCGSGDLIVSP